MLVLFETPAGFALFKVLDEGKLSKVEELWKEFSTSNTARKVVKLKAFSKFENTAEALSAVTLLIEANPAKACGSSCVHIVMVKHWPLQIQNLEMQLKTNCKLSVFTIMLLWS